MVPRRNCYLTKVILKIKSMKLCNFLKRGYPEVGDTGNILPIVHSTVSNVSTWARDSALVAPYNVPLARNVTTFNPHN